ncbi:MAG: DUF4268 domain-containing protein [Chloroflexota bacterium]
MPYQVEQLLRGKPEPLCASPQESVLEALQKMLENDYSQLPVVEEKGEKKYIKGIIRYKDIVQSMLHLELSLADLQVVDAMLTTPRLYYLDDDLFDMLDALQEHNAVLITDREKVLLGIITTWDVMAYFRARSEDLMRIEDIESTIKELIRNACTDADGNLNEKVLEQSIADITRKQRDNSEKPPEFEELTLSQYIHLLLHSRIWERVGPVFRNKRDILRKNLDDIREIRNLLTHFRDEPTAQQRQKIQIFNDWLNRRVQTWQSDQRHPENLLQYLDGRQIFSLDRPETSAASHSGETQAKAGTGSPPEIEVTEGEDSRNRYAALADWLQNQPDDVERVSLKFSQIEEIIQYPLPASAYRHRAWWANDSVAHSHSRQWLEAGWRTSFINLDEQRVEFTRIRERKDLYNQFFNRLLDALEKKSDFPLEKTNPQGRSWVIVKRLRCSICKGGNIAFVFSFSRDQRFRIELYIDAGEQALSKIIFDRIYAYRQALEDEFGNICWERMDHHQASRIAIYQTGHIQETDNHDQLIEWAVNTMPRFYRALAPLVETALQELSK